MFKSGNTYFLGRHHTEEAKMKISKALKGNTCALGKHHSEETKRKISNANKGKYFSPETRMKLSKANKGRHCTVETRMRISKARKGKHLSKETKEKLSKAGKGKYLGEKSPNWKGGLKLNRKRSNDKRKNDLKYRLNSRITRSILHSLKNNTKNGRTWQSLVCYNGKQLKRRLESTMPTGYSWQDFMNGKLHIDHIIPINVFNFDKPEHLDFRRCWDLDNLQLLPKHENLVKHNKLKSDFQPSLKLEI